MALKKKLPAQKTATGVQSAPRDKVPVNPAREEKPLSESEKQLQAFGNAMHLFRQQQFREAKEAFAEAVSGPQKEISHNAKTHILMCERRLEKASATFETLDDHYNYAIERLNARDLENARKHLDCAMEMVRKDGDTSADHLFYALALCAGVSGDAEGAFQNLKQAIELNPRNRAAARQDSDLAQVAQQPAIQHLLYPEKQGPL